MTRTMIDLFCGAGGLSLGLERAGFSSVFAVEMKVDACNTYSLRFPEVELHRGRIEEVDFNRFKGEIDLIAGGPPCQPFSSGGKREGQEDERDMLPEFVRAVLAVRPRAFLLENVPGLAGKHKPYLLEILRPLIDLYRMTDPTILDARDFGLPQKRRRMMVYGMQKEFDFRIPVKSDARRRSAGEVLTSQPVGIINESKVVYAKAPDLRPSPFDGLLFNGGGRPIDLEGAAPTILASAGGNKTPFIDVHGLVPAYHSHLVRGGKPRAGALEGARRLTPQESAAIQTFPQGMLFEGSRSSQYQQIGNAVPPDLAFFVGDAIQSAMKRRSSRRSARAA